MPLSCEPAYDSGSYRLQYIKLKKNVYKCIDSIQKAFINRLEPCGALCMMYGCNLLASKSWPPFTASIKLRHFFILLKLDWYERRKSYTSSMAWGWVNHWVIFIFWVNYPFKCDLWSKHTRLKYSIAFPVLQQRITIADISLNWCGHIDEITLSIANSVAMFEVHLTQKSLSNYAASCCLTQRNCVTNLNPLQNLYEEIFHYQVKFQIRNYNIKCDRTIFIKKEYVRNVYKECFWPKS